MQPRSWRHRSLVHHRYGRRLLLDLCARRRVTAPVHRVRCHRLPLRRLLFRIFRQPRQPRNRDPRVLDCPSRRNQLARNGLPRLLHLHLALQRIATHRCLRQGPDRLSPETVRRWRLALRPSLELLDPCPRRVRRDRPYPHGLRRLKGPHVHRGRNSREEVSVRLVNNSPADRVRLWRDSR
jgi:hypothetical protein